jgi:NADH dehydrogenase
MAEKKRILILGGGYGGVWAGKKLESYFRRRTDVEITLVDKRPFHTLMTELHEVAAWRAQPDSVQVNFRKIFGAAAIECVVDSIQKVDFEAKVAQGRAREYPFDYVILGTGSRPEFFGTPGVEENSFTLWSFEDAMRLRQHLETIFDRAGQETDPAERRRLLTFVVAGAGFTGIEMAGELLEYRDEMCRKHYMENSEARIVVVEALPSILPILEEPLRAKAEGYLRKRGCELMIGTPIIGAEKGKVLLKERESLQTATFIWTCGVKGTDFAAGLGIPVGKRGRIETNASLRSPARPFVFAVGDAAGLMVEGKPMAMIVESAHFSAEAAAKNIIASIDGGREHEFKPNYHGFMISLGSRYGVSNAGGIRLSGFMALVMKHLINMYYLFNIAGLNQGWEYFKHEFLDMKSRRSIIGGFFSHKLRGYWPLPLRLWLGLSWLFEGINKIGEGWFAFSSGSQSGWMFSPGVVQAGIGQYADATSAATAASGTAATSAASAATGPSAVAAASAASAAGGTAATSAASAAVGTAGTAVPSHFHALWDMSSPILDPKAGIVLWFKRVFMDGIFSHLTYQFFQSMVVVTEMGIGLLLIGGLFTWFGAVASIGLCLIFTLSGLFSWSQAWYVFAAILMMGGAGRAFGLDYWTVPLFKKWWNGTRLVRRSHLYAGDPSK